MTRDTRRSSSVCSSAASMQEATSRPSASVRSQPPRTFVAYHVMLSADTRVLGLEARRLDVVERAIVESGDVPGMLSYCLSVVMSLVTNIEFRLLALRQLSNIYLRLESPDYINICRIFVFLDDAQGISDLFKRLLAGNEVTFLTLSPRRERERA